MNSLVKRTAPSGRLTVSRIWPPVEIVSSQLPPPRSTIRTGAAVTRNVETRPRWIKRASSSPEIMSTFHPVVDLDPLQKSSRIARIAQSAGRDHAHRIRALLLYRAMKTAQNFYGVGDRLGRQQTGAKHAVAQSRNLAVFVDFEQSASGEARIFQANRVRSDIDRG